MLRLTQQYTARWNAALGEFADHLSITTQDRAPVNAATV